MLNEPPVMVTPPSNTTLPPKNVTAVSLPIDKPPGQSTNQLPTAATTAPLGLQLEIVEKRVYPLGATPVVFPMAVTSRSMYGDVVLALGQGAIVTPWYVG
jgi:hypothetical protein